MYKAHSLVQSTLTGAKHTHWYKAHSLCGTAIVTKSDTKGYGYNEQGNSPSQEVVENVNLGGEEDHDKVDQDVHSLYEHPGEGDQ